MYLEIMLQVLDEYSDQFENIEYFQSKVVWCRSFAKSSLQASIFCDPSWSETQIVFQDNH